MHPKELWKNTESRFDWEPAGGLQTLSAGTQGQDLVSYSAMPGSGPLGPTIIPNKTGHEIDQKKGE